MSNMPSEGYVGKATLTNFTQCPRKARLVVDMVRGKKVSQAVSMLAQCDKKTAPVVEKLLMSAVANAQDKYSDLDADDLYIKGAWVNEAMRLKRSMPRARGSASAIIKRRRTITLVLDEK